MFMNKSSMSQTCLYKISYKKATCVPDFYNSQSLGRHLAIVHSRVTVDGCSMEYEYKLLHVRQFTTTVEGTTCRYCLWLKQNQSNSLLDHTKPYLNRTEQQYLKGYWILKNEYRVTSQTNYGELEKKIFKNSLCGPAAMSRMQQFFSRLRPPFWAWSDCRGGGGGASAGRRRAQGREMLTMLAVGWRTSALKSEEAGRFREVAGVSIVDAGSPCSL